MFRIGCDVSAISFLGPCLIHLNEKISIYIIIVVVVVVVVVNIIINYYCYYYRHHQFRLKNVAINKYISVCALF